MLDLSSVDAGGVDLDRGPRGSVLLSFHVLELDCEREELERLDSLFVLVPFLS